MTEKKIDIVNKFIENRDEESSTERLMPFYASKRQYSIDEANFIPVDIYETGDLFTVEVEIPGLVIEEIKVSVTNEYLIIEGTKDEKMENDGKVNFLCMERSFGPFRRTIKIEGNINKDQIKASYSEGILYIKLPKRKERRKKIRWITIEKEEN